MNILQIVSQERIYSTIRFNSNFLEANVINILLLLFGLIYVLIKFLGSILSERQSKVLFAIRESEERLEQANVRLSEAEKQLAQTQVIIAQIIEEAESTSKKVRQSILEQGKLDIEKLMISSKESVKFAETQVRLQIQQQIIALALKKVSMQLQNNMTSISHNQIIDQNIMQLKGKSSL